uniref:Uncharacterized protein n=1 Tax=Cacopsylla melanoneura TaxID=428564 RepID=A0A8D8Z7U0_9HEMI
MIDLSSFIGIEGNKFFTSKLMSFALVGSFGTFFSFSIRHRLLLIEYFDLNFKSSGKTEMNFLQISLDGASTHDTTGLKGFPSLWSFGRPYNLGIWGLETLGVPFRIWGHSDIHLFTLATYLLRICFSFVTTKLLFTM